MIDLVSFVWQRRTSRIYEQMVRRLNILKLRAPEVLQQSEQVIGDLDPSGVGVSLRMKTSRPDQLIAEFQRLAFQNFEPLGRRQDCEGWHRVHFRFM